MTTVRQLLSILLLTIPLASTEVAGQKFLPDDPIKKDLDNLPIEKPQTLELSLTFDALENTFGSEASDLLVRAENINTLGGVPDSSWFTNRIGVRDLTVEELAKGADESGGPDTTTSMTVIGAGLRSVTEGLLVQDSRGNQFYIIPDPAGLPSLATGAGIVANKFLYAAGYNVLPASIAYVDPGQLTIGPNAVVRMLGEKQAPVDQDFLTQFFRDKEQKSDGTYRVLAYQLAGAGFEGLGEFKFYGTRSDDPNDIFLHENRRELRGLRLFSAWLNHYNSRSINTVDAFGNWDGNPHVRHYLIDFTTALGSGYDLNDRIIPKDPRAGNEYTLFGDWMATLKTAGTLGWWERSWMQTEYPYPQYAEAGRIEGDQFEPRSWKPDYPNAAFDRMLPDDALWAAEILSRFSDEGIRAIVQTAQYSDPAAENYLVETLIKRRDRIVNYYFRQISPIFDFSVRDGVLEFENKGRNRDLKGEVVYSHQWFAFNNQSLDLSPITQPQTSEESRILIPSTAADYMMARIQTRCLERRGWRLNVDVYVRMDSPPTVVGVERATGSYVLKRSIEGGLELADDIEFGGTYRGLDQEPRQLINKWFQSFNQATDQSISPEEGYDNLPLTTRTTFEAVTHALLETILTDESGKLLGNAFELIDEVENVRGRVKGAGGDQQFRMYVSLTPDSVEILEASQQFGRTADNTVFHKGYPRSYRLSGGDPSIQVSVSEDGKRADIDVDYRSSKFPQALMNGHLTASNSDVRAGNNHNRHAKRWEGFSNWWRNLFGLPDLAYLVEEPDEPLIAVNPPKQKDVTVAAEDFLKSWIVEQQPGTAVAYVADSALACMEQPEGSEQLNYGVARIALAARMAAASSSVGTTASLASVLFSHPLEDLRLRSVEQQPGVPFSLYDVPESRAFELDCAAQNDPEIERKQGSPDKYGQYFMTAFRTEESGSGTALLWAKQGNFWKIISFMSEPNSRVSDIPDTREEIVVTVPRMAADPSFLDADSRFRAHWVNQEIDEALQVFSERSDPCLTLYLEPDREARVQLHQGMADIARALAEAEDPDGMVQAVEVVHPDIAIIMHEEEDVFTLGALPDYLGPSHSCENLGTDAFIEEPSQKTYGNYYATLFRLDLVGEDPSVLIFIWTREGGDWKITALHILEP